VSDLVQLTKDGGVAVITINHPPVNALSPGVPEGIGEAIEQIEKDDSVVTAVLIGAGRTFVAGADIKEFGKMTSGKTPRGEGFKRLLLPIEDCRKPVVVAIHGTAFGGGLELAMAGHYRCGGSRCAGRPARSEARRIVGARAAVRAPGRTREDF
jgi:3-hydroxyacyl-CoA dehydrogenase